MLLRAKRHIAIGEMSFLSQRYFFIISCFENFYLQNQIDDPNAEKVEYVVIVCK